MTDSQTSERLVVNVDALWGADARWYRFGDVSLGDRGIPQLVVFYAIAGVLLGWAATTVPLAGISFWPGGALLAIAVAGLGFARCGGLRVHEFAPAAAAFLFGPRHLHGWRRCPPPTRPWRPPSLVLESDGSRPGTGALAFTGPGLVVRRWPCRRIQQPGRGRPRGARQVLELLPGPGVLAAAREFEVPAGVTVLVREAR